MWRVIHIASGLHIPLVDWPPTGIPHRYAEIAAASLATSGIDWTRQAADLVTKSQFPKLAEAARTASTVAYDAAVHAGDQTDDRPRPCDLATRRAAGRRVVTATREEVS